MKLLYVTFLFFIGMGTTIAQTKLSWAKEFGNSDISNGNVLQLDDAGNSYMAGAYPSSGITFGNIVLSGAGNESRFITKSDRDGNTIWATRLTRTGGFQDQVNPEKIAVDVLGNVYVTGFYLSGATVGNLTIPGSYGYFIAKLNTAGSAEWIKTITSADNISDGNISIYLNARQQISIAGLYNSSITFDGTHTLLNTGDNTLTDAFLAKYDANGNVISAVELGILNKSPIPAGGNYEPETFRTDSKGNLYRLTKRSYSIIKYNNDGIPLMTKTLAVTGTLTLWDMTADASGNIFLCILPQGTISLEGESINNTSGGIFTKLDSSGNLKWNHTQQTMNGDAYYKIKTDAIGNLYVSGANANHTTLIRLLMAKYDNNGTLIWDQSIYAQNADNTVFGEANPGNLVLSNTDGNVLFMGFYKKYIRFSDTVAFTSPATTGRIFLAQYGFCTSITAPVISSEGNPSFCKGGQVVLSSTPAQEYLWSNGDTTATITVTTPGDYHVFSIKDRECFTKSASIHINELPAPDSTLTRKKSLLIANATNATYQWRNCSDNEPIANQTTQYFIPAVKGNYAVTITDINGCKITSACDSVTEAGTGQPAEQNGITLYPNPAESDITLFTGRVIKAIMIYNVTGQKVLETTEKKINVSQLAAGTYFLVAETSSGIWRGKFIRK